MSRLADGELIRTGAERIEAQQRARAEDQPPGQAEQTQQDQQDQATQRTAEQQAPQPPSSGGDQPMKAKRSGRRRRSEPARKFGLTLGESEHALLVAHGSLVSYLQR